MAMVNRYTWTMIFLLITYSISSCSQDRNVEFFKDTEAYDLAKAIGNNDTTEITKLITEKPNLINVTAYNTGSNALDLALYLENYEAFKKLIDLGANPNFINPLDKRTPLIEACRFYFKHQPDWRIDLRYIQLLLDHGADPNYFVDSSFTDYRGYNHYYTSPLSEACGVNLDMVKLLLKYGADPFKKIKYTQENSFGYAVSFRKFDIIYYYLDSLKPNVLEPLYVHPKTKKKRYIQDYIKQLCSRRTPLNSECKQLILQLKNMGVDFKNHEYEEDPLGRLVTKEAKDSWDSIIQ